MQWGASSSDRMQVPTRPISATRITGPGPNSYTQQGDDSVNSAPVNAPDFIIFVVENFNLQDH
jgi:hypothetical protein